MTQTEALRLALEDIKELLEWTSAAPTEIQRSARKALATLDAALEAKDEPDKYAMDIECTKCGAKQSGVLTVHTTSPQRKPLTDETRNWIVATCPTPRHIIDAVERMHGIKGEA